tara:strand:- start:8824 stop:9582 length:759 start_codon:yes stop_codon:yes gene_type:complete
MHKISVITVCFNAAEHIEETIQSVVEQKGVEFEYIVVDGLSTDGTIDIIKRYQASIDHWVSDADGGIADAMNKGVKLATGEYLIFLHADDYFIKADVLANALTSMATEVDIYAFDVLYQTKDKQLRKSTKPFGFLTNFKTPVMHQGAFCKRALLTKLDGFNTNYRIAMDYDFFLRAYQQGASMEIKHHVVSVMRDSGISSRKDWPSLKVRFAEEKRVHFENNSSIFMKAIYGVYWSFYIPYRRAVFIVGDCL